jgi:hypothetical protein
MSKNERHAAGAMIPVKRPNQTQDEIAVDKLLEHKLEFQRKPWIDVSVKVPM